MRYDGIFDALREQLSARCGEPILAAVVVHLGMLRSMPSALAISEFRPSLGEGDPPETMSARVRTLPTYLVRFGA